MADRFASDRDHLPVSGTVLASANRTADVNSDDIGNVGAQGVIVVIDITDDVGTDSIVFTIQGKDPVSGKYYDILASASLAAVGTTVLQVHPALTAAANEKASALLPDVWRVEADQTGTDGLTYSVGAILTP